MQPLQASPSLDTLGMPSSAHTSATWGSILRRAVSLVGKLGGLIAGLQFLPVALGSILRDAPTGHNSEVGSVPTKGTLVDSSASSQSLTMPSARHLSGNDSLIIAPGNVTVIPDNTTRTVRTTTAETLHISIDPNSISSQTPIVYGEPFLRDFGGVPPGAVALTWFGINIRSGAPYALPLSDILPIDIVPINDHTLFTHSLIEIALLDTSQTPPVKMGSIQRLGPEIEQSVIEYVALTAPGTAVMALRSSGSSSSRRALAKVDISDPYSLTITHETSFVADPTAMHFIESSRRLFVCDKHSSSPKLFEYDPDTLQITQSLVLTTFGYGTAVVSIENTLLVSTSISQNVVFVDMGDFNRVENKGDKTGTISYMEIIKFSFSDSEPAHPFLISRDKVTLQLFSIDAANQHLSLVRVWDFDGTINQFHVSGHLVYVSLSESLQVYTLDLRAKGNAARIHIHTLPIPNGVPVLGFQASGTFLLPNGTLVTTAAGYQSNQVPYIYPLTFDAPNTRPNQMRLDIDRSQLPAGVSTIQVEIPSSEGPIVIPVTIDTNLRPEFDISNTTWPEVVASPGTTPAIHITATRDDIPHSLDIPVGVIRNLESGQTHTIVADPGNELPIDAIEYYPSDAWDVFARLHLSTDKSLRGNRLLRFSIQDERGDASRSPAVISVSVQDPVITVDQTTHGYNPVSGEYTLYYDPNAVVIDMSLPEAVTGIDANPRVGTISPAISVTSTHQLRLQPDKTNTDGHVITVPYVNMIGQETSIAVRLIPNLGSVSLDPASTAIATTQYGLPTITLPVATARHSTSNSLDTYFKVLSNLGLDYTVEQRTDSGAYVAVDPGKCGVVNGQFICTYDADDVNQTRFYRVTARAKNPSTGTVLLQVPTQVLGISQTIGDQPPVFGTIPTTLFQKQIPGTIPVSIVEPDGEELVFSATDPNGAVLSVSSPTVSMVSAGRKYEFNVHVTADTVGGFPVRIQAKKKTTGELVGTVITIAQVQYQPPVFASAQPDYKVVPNSPISIPAPHYTTLYPSHIQISVQRDDGLDLPDSLTIHADGSITGKVGPESFDDTSGKHLSFKIRQTLSDTIGNQEVSRTFNIIILNPATALPATNRTLTVVEDGSVPFIVPFGNTAGNLDPDPTMTCRMPNGVFSDGFAPVGSFISRPLSDWGSVRVTPAVDWDSPFDVPCTISGPNTPEQETTLSIQVHSIPDAPIALVSLGSVSAKAESVVSIPLNGLVSSVDTVEPDSLLILVLTSGNLVDLTTGIVLDKTLFYPITSLRNYAVQFKMGESGVEELVMAFENAHGLVSSPATKQQVTVIPEPSLVEKYAPWIGYGALISAIMYKVFLAFSTMHYYKKRNRDIAIVYQQIRDFLAKNPLTGQATENVQQSIQTLKDDILTALINTGKLEPSNKTTVDAFYRQVVTFSFLTLNTLCQSNQGGASCATPASTQRSGQATAVKRPGLHRRQPHKSFASSCAPSGSAKLTDASHYYVGIENYIPLANKLDNLCESQLSNVSTQETCLKLSNALFLLLMTGLCTLADQSNQQYLQVDFDRWRELTNAVRKSMEYLDRYMTAKDSRRCPDEIKPNTILANLKACFEILGCMKHSGTSGRIVAENIQTLSLSMWTNFRENRLCRPHGGAISILLQTTFSNFSTVHTGPRYVFTANPGNLLTYAKSLSGPTTSGVLWLLADSGIFKMPSDQQDSLSGIIQKKSFEHSHWIMNLRWLLCRFNFLTKRRNLMLSLLSNDDQKNPLSVLSGQPPASHKTQQHPPFQEGDSPASSASKGSGTGIALQRQRPTLPGTPDPDETRVTVNPMGPGADS